VQWVLATNFTPDDWRITVPTYIAYSTLSISVGWLSEVLHQHYGDEVERARLAALGQLAMTMKHQLNNALTAVVAESELLMADTSGFSSTQLESVQSIVEAAHRMTDNVEQITRLETAPVTSWPAGVTTLDLSAASSRHD
jgi:signal transduction histidine kinase